MKAKTLLGLRQTSSLKEIKNKYKNLMKKWHPDKHKDDPKKATTMSAQVNEAYEVIMDYISNYEFSFDEEHVKKATYSPEEWWHDKFGGR